MSEFVSPASAVTFIASAQGTKQIATGPGVVFEPPGPMTECMPVVVVTCETSAPVTTHTASISVGTYSARVLWTNTCIQHPLSTAKEQLQLSHACLQHLMSFTQHVLQRHPQLMCTTRHQYQCGLHSTSTSVVSTAPTSANEYETPALGSPRRQPCHWSQMLHWHQLPPPRQPLQWSQSWSRHLLSPSGGQLLWSIT